MNAVEDPFTNRLKQLSFHGLHECTTVNILTLHMLCVKNLLPVTYLFVEKVAKNFWQEHAKNHMSLNREDRRKKKES